MIRVKYNKWSCQQINNTTETVITTATITRQDKTRPADDMKLRVELCALDAAQTLQYQQALNVHSTSENFYISKQTCKNVFSSRLSLKANVSSSQISWKTVPQLQTCSCKTPVSIVAAKYTKGWLDGQMVRVLQHFKDKIDGYMCIMTEMVY